MTAALPANRPYYPALDGLRGIAILLVVVYHNFGFINQFIFGWLGVDLFFVLSGYLITDILMKEMGSPNYLGNFYTRRVLRIFPLYYLSLIVFLILFPAIGLYENEFRFYSENQLWHWTYLQNWLYSFHLPADARILNHFWSLAVEEQFYLFWPFLVLFIKKPGRLFWIMLIALVAVVVTRIILWQLKVENLNYTTLYTFTRIDGICIGSMVALLMRYKPEFLSKQLPFIITTLALLNFLFYFLNKDGEFPYFAFVGYTTFAGLFGILVYHLVTEKNSFFHKVLSFQPLRFFGKVSYGFYIFHWPVYIMTSAYFRSEYESITGTTNGSEIVAASLSSLLAFLISVISYYSFERYFLELKNRMYSTVK